MYQSYFPQCASFLNKLNLVKCGNLPVYIALIVVKMTNKHGKLRIIYLLLLFQNNSKKNNKCKYFNSVLKKY